MAAGFIKKEKDAAVQKKRALQDKGAEEGQKAEAQVHPRSVHPETGCGDG